MIHQKLSISLLLVGLSALPVVGFAADQSESRTSAQDPETKVHVLTAEALKIKPVPSTRTLQLEPKAFIEKAALRSNMITVLGNLATRRAKNEDLRTFSEQLVDNYDQAFERLGQLAAQNGILLPNEMSREEIRLTNHLTEMVDLDFDQDYVWHLLQMLRESVVDYSAAAQSSQPEIQSLARDRLPVIKEQLTRVTQIGQQLLKSGAAGYVKSKAYPDPNAPTGAAPAGSSAPAKPQKTVRPDEKGNPNDEPLPQTE